MKMTQEMFMNLRNAYITNNESIGAHKLHKLLSNYGLKIAYKYRLSYEDKEDAVSEAVYDALKMIEDYVPRFQWTTWFGTIVNRKLIDSVRKNKVRRTNYKVSIDSFFTGEDSNSSAYDISDSSMDIIDALDLEEKRNFILRKIKALPDGYMKKVAYLAFVEGLSNSEIMKKLKMTKHMVAILKFRFVEYLRKNMGLL